MNENRRVQQVLSGNTSAFSYFVETYQHMAITIAYRICGNMQDAEDVVQDSFVKAYRNLHAFRKESKFSSWLYRIVYNTAVTYSKTHVRDKKTDNVTDHTLASDLDAETALETSERSEMIENILYRMPKGDALLLTLYYLEENKVREVAQIMGLNESNVKIRLYRARLLFKELWMAHYRHAGV